MENLHEYMKEYNQRLEDGVKNTELTDYDEIDLKKGSGYLRWKHENKIDYIKDTVPEEEQEDALFIEECQYVKALRKYGEMAKKLGTDVDVKNYGLEKYSGLFD